MRIDRPSLISKKFSPLQMRIVRPSLISKVFSASQMRINRPWLISKTFSTFQIRIDRPSLILKTVLGVWGHPMRGGRSTADSMKRVTGSSVKVARGAAVVGSRCILRSLPRCSVMRCAVPMSTGNHSPLEEPVFAFLISRLAALSPALGAPPAGNERQRSGA